MSKNIFYEMTVPFFLARLEAIYVLLETTHKEAVEKGISENDILDMKLVPDMYPLQKQVQIVCESAKFCCGILCGKTPPLYTNHETTVGELLVRIRKAIDYLDLFLEEDFEKAETRKIEVPNFENKHFKPLQYLRHYAIPNFMFHDVTIYNILRADGFEIGKVDFLHSLPLIKNE